MDSSVTTEYKANCSDGQQCLAVRLHVTTEYKANCSDGQQCLAV